MDSTTGYISFIMLFAAYSLASAECPIKHKAVICEGLVSSEGFTYTLPEDMVLHLENPDCEHGWYYSDGTFIAESNAPGTFVLTLTINTCVNLQWQLFCEKFCCFINYTVKHEASHGIPPRNATFPRDENNKDTGSPDWRTAVSVGSGIISVMILSAAIWFCWKKKNI